VREIIKARVAKAVKLIVGGVVHAADAVGAAELARCTREVDAKDVGGAGLTRAVCVELQA